MALNYLQALERCFPDTQAYITTGDPTNYADIIWITTQIPQATIDSSSCVIGVFDDTTGDVVTTDYNVSGTDSGPIFSLVFNKDSISKNTWLSHNGDNSLTSDRSPAVIPWNCRLVAMTFSNQAEAADTDVQIYKADAGAGSSDALVHTWEIRGSRLARKTIFQPDVTFIAGDKVGIYLKGQGSDVKYVSVLMYLQITDSDTADLTESFSGNF